MRTFAALALLVILVAGCDMPVAPSLHDVYLYGPENVRYSYAYGTEGSSLLLDDQEVMLARIPAGAAPDDPLVVRNALLVGDAPYLVAPVAPLPTPPVTVQRIPLTTDLQLRTSAPIDTVLYFDGDGWFVLAEVAPAGLDTRVVPRPRLGKLRGLGRLTGPEADALAAYLEGRGPLALALLRDDALPNDAVDGLADYLQTGFYLQPGLATDASAYQPPAESLIWEVLASGAQAVGFDAPSYRMIRNEAELRSLWNQAYGNQLTVPPLPRVDFARETLLAVFLGTKPSGGFGIEIEDVNLEGNDLFVDVRETTPPPGAITTQALTSPWLMLRVLRGGIGAAWFRDPDSGRLLGVARRTE